MNAPTLIVGLGGIGSKIALRVADMVTEEQRQRIGFAVFDTDVNELARIKEKNPFVHAIQTSTKLSVGEYLDIDTHARDTWFPVNAILNSKTLTEGAGQVRAISRMAFETAVRSGKMEDLHRAIEDLYKLEGEEYQQALRVIIVSTLAGGTGSGLILPVSLYIKNYLATRFRQSANISRGFFILPEVLYHVIPGETERNNLKSNAYATLKEIDAFLMRGDSTLPDRFKDSVTMKFPSVSSGEFEEYNVRPFDFCFLFDGQNSDGRKLNSFNSYLDHAANCIYAMSIGPMNKRSNSSEDNTIRKLVSERGRNRYAGAGTSMLIYPKDVVRKYLALNWAKECVSEEWLMFDRAFKDMVRNNAEMRRNGIHTSDIKESKNYINSVESEANKKNPFARAIMESCNEYDENGVTVRGFKWDIYLERLENRITQDNDSSTVAELDELQSSAMMNISNIEPGKTEDVESAFVDAYNSVIIYRGTAVKRCSEMARTLAYSIFKSNSVDVLKSKDDFCLEKYMRNSSTGDFIHPCAVRYFLYKVEESMTRAIAGLKQEVEAEEEYFAHYEDNVLDDSSTDEKEGIGNLGPGMRTRFIDRVRKTLSIRQEELRNSLVTYVGNVNEYRNNAVYLAVLEEGLSYVKSLSESFANFFKTFDGKITGISREIEIIENKYMHTKGTAARYVCASKECLKAMNEKMAYAGGAIDIDTKLAEAIYSRVRSYSMLSVKADNGDYFSSIFDNDVIKYFEDKLTEIYGPDIDVDVITAIEKELEYEQNIVDMDAAEAYVRDVIKQAKILAAPFIEKPMGEEKQPINSCAYSNELYTDDDSPRSKLLNSELKDFGGEADEDIPLNMILFYKSFYGLRANDLSKFAPPQKSQTYDRSAGEYFKAYYELVSKIHPVPSVSKVITPHIDRWWHNPTKMPDLDEGNQEKQLNDICAAFFWAFVAHKVDLYENGNSNQFAYTIIDRLVEEDDSDRQDSRVLTVSNGTPCDQLYEVLDSISIYPELVHGILDSVEELQNKEAEAGKTAFDNEVMDYINNYTIRTLGDNNSTLVRSIFELPFLLKRSTTTEVYNEKDGLRLMQVAMDESKKLLKRFSAENDYAENVGKLFAAQFDKLIENLKLSNTEDRNVFRELLFSRICEMLSHDLKALGLNDLAKDIKTRGEELALSKTK